MLRLSIFLFFLSTILNASGQKVIESYAPQTGLLQYGEGPRDFFPLNEKGYTLIMPENDRPLTGVIISLEDGRFDIKGARPQSLIHPQANSKGLVVLYVSTGIPVDLYFSENSLHYVDSILSTVFAKYTIPNKNIFFIGTMVAGHRALKYIEYCRTKKSRFQPDIKGVVLSECAIDWVRQWYECQKQVRDHFNDAQLFEGHLVTYLFKANLGDTPQTNLDKYLDFSPYSYFDTSMRHIRYFKDLAIRAYTFAPTNYWFSANGKGVNDSNYPDMSGIINELKVQGDQQAELIVFSNETRAKTDKMEIQSNTWNLVDKKELVDWVVARTK
ncbi:MAG TPA: hypothetical protein VK563_04425 [Puia sp.]|nr:hypothetical protein [Puia sp.]